MRFYTRTGKPMPKVITIQPYWRSLYNHTRKGLEGGAPHISFEIRPAELRWT